jgi:hypothetical protein
MTKISGSCNTHGPQDIRNSIDDFVQKFMLASRAGTLADWTNCPRSEGSGIFGVLGALINAGPTGDLDADLQLRIKDRRDLPVPRKPTSTGLKIRNPPSIYTPISMS